MVRLKERLAITCRLLVLHFNSNMVRLKGKVHTVRSVANLFQFQHGAIKSNLPLFIIMEEDIFQFQHGAIKRSTEQNITQNILNFNSNMVRLKESGGGFWRYFGFYFNSNMVRLKGKFSFAMLRPAKFQFQHGAIKSVVLAVYLFYSMLFQFQHGAIKSAIDSVLLILLWLFQFQHGAIKSSKQKRPYRALTVISIPTWCD